MKEPQGVPGPVPDPETARRWALALAVTLASWAAVAAAAAGTGVLAEEQGCAPNDESCRGPEGTYLTVLGHELEHQVEPALVAGAASAGILGLLAAAGGRGLLDLAWPWRVTAALAAFPLLFLVVVAVDPTVVVY